MATATLTSKGQITLPKSVREHLRIGTGDVVDFVVKDNGDVVVKARKGDVMELKGFLHRPGQKPVSVEEMDEAILREHSRKR